MPAAQEITHSFSDGYAAFARLWLPERPRGGVLYLHGIQSHGGWYEASATRLADAGWAVLLPDRRGSGRNQAERGHAPSARRLLQDNLEWLDTLQQSTGSASAHVLGVSWGGKLALALRRFASGRVRSLGLAAPGLFPQVDLPLLQKVRVGLSVLAAPRALFDIPLNDPTLFTANPAGQQLIRDDPLKLTKVTTSFLLASRRLDRFALAARHDPVGCPLRVFLAGHDRIIDNHRTRDCVRRLRWADRLLIEYPEAHHTLEFEPDPEPYFADLQEWPEQAERSLR
jgi:alpha-beta hydrolase superfamily lysophospholipase